MSLFIRQDDPMTASIRDDYILRLVRDATAAVARLLGMRTAGDFSAAQTVLESAYRGLLGPDADLISRLDTETGARLLIVPEKMALMSDLLHEEAEIQRAAKTGDGLESDKRALEYALEAAVLEPDSEDILARVRLRMSGAGSDQIGSGYKEALRRMGQ
jgi:hypothetical protein